MEAGAGVVENNLQVIPAIQNMKKHNISYGMSCAVDVSRGIDPIPVWSDIRNDWRIVRVDGFQYTFLGPLPFTVKEMKSGKYKQYCVDKELVLKHRQKAIKIIDLRTLEDISRA